MKTPLAAYIGWLLLIAALGFYGYGMVTAIMASLPGEIKPKLPPEEILATISSMQALLLANLGAMLGISIAKPDSSIARTLLISNKAIAVKALPDPLTMREKIQLFATSMYLLGLIACLVTWLINRANGSVPLNPMVAESAKMFLGVVLAYGTAVFSNRNA